jgi:hypothetical protein
LLLPDGIANALQERGISTVNRGRTRADDEDDDNDVENVTDSFAA